MNTPKNKKATPQPRRLKALFLEMLESEFGGEPWDGEDEKPSQRLPSYPMKFHSNKWVERL